MSGRLAKLAGVVTVGIVLAVTAALAFRPASTPPPVAFVELALAPAGDVYAGAVVETGSAPARAALRLQGGASLRLDASSRVRLASGSDVVLERGAVYLDHTGGGSGVEVRTTLGVVREIGTQFEVRLVGEGGSTLRVRVREGKVIVRHGERSHPAGAGEQLTLHDDGTLISGRVPIHGDDWDWVLETAPVPEIEGRDVRSFFEWFAREGGWALRFSDERLAERAATIVLHGDAKGLKPQEAARMVLRGTGLGYRLDDGTLVVAAVEPLPAHEPAP